MNNYFDEWSIYFNLIMLNELTFYFLLYLYICIYNQPIYLLYVCKNSITFNNHKLSQLLKNYINN